jgi:hypothetical protein
MWQTFFQRLAKRFKFEAQFGSTTDRISLERRGLPVLISCDKVGKHSAFVSLYIRTTSWEFEGERTDLHDIFSVLLCCFLRVNPNGISCRIWDVPNPAMPMPETEVYARYVTFDQPDASIFTLDEDGYKKLSHILKAILIFEFLMPRLVEFIQNKSKTTELDLFDFRGKTITRWASVVTTALGQKLGNRDVQYNLRRNPCWLYYRSLRPSISVIYSPRLAVGLQILLNSANHKVWKTILGGKGEMFVSEIAKNFVSFSTQRLGKRVLKGLKDNIQRVKIGFIPLENHCVVVGTKHVLFVKTNCGRVLFERERESIRDRHLQESTLLFPPSKIIWNSRIDAADFQKLIQELLMREPGVRWVRETGHVNEPDGGRDLIAEWDTGPMPGQVLEEGSSPISRHRVIVQCKASKFAVGKTHVRDIHDLLKRYDASGYFLATSSYITGGLMGHLEKLRYQNEFWSDWWTSTEIEDRLMKNENIAVKYPRVVTVKR